MRLLLFVCCLILVFSVSVFAEGEVKEDMKADTAKEEVKADDEFMETELSWVPSRPGRYHFTLEVPPQLEEEVSGGLY